MNTIKNALLYVKNHRFVQPELVTRELVRLDGVSKASAVSDKDGFFFVDYQPDAMSISALSETFRRQGVQMRVIAI